MTNKASRDTVYLRMLFFRLETGIDFLKFSYQYQLWSVFISQKCFCGLCMFKCLWLRLVEDFSSTQLWTVINSFNLRICCTIWVAESEESLEEYIFLQYLLYKYELCGCLIIWSFFFTIKDSQCFCRFGVNA